MAANELVQARIDGAIKKEAAAVLAAIGLTVSDAVRLMLTRVARDHALPFDPLIAKAMTIAAMNAARAGEPETVTLEQLQAVLDADDDDAKTHLSRLVERAAAGEPFVIAKGGQPLVKVVPIEAEAPKRPIGFLKGEVRIPDDFDTMCADEIAEMFGL